MFIPLNTLFVQFLAAWSGLPSEDYGFLSTSSGIQATAVKAVNCDGKTFSKDRVESTWTNAKGYAVDHCKYLTKKYPHKLHNPAGLTLTACAGKGPDGKNREINEFPLQDGSWCGVSDPGKYRVLYDSKTKEYCGSVYHTDSGTNNFLKCT